MLVSKRKAFGVTFQEGADDGKGGSGGAVSLDTPEVKAAIQAAIDKEVAGLKAKNAELLGKLKDAPKVDPKEWEQLQELKKKVEANEEMKLLAEGKLEDVLNRRLEAKERDWQAQLQARDTKLQEYDTVVKQKDERLKSVLIDSEVRQAYVGLDFEPAAMDDIMLQARHTFVMDEDGAVVPRDADGVIRMGKDGRTPLTPSEWLEGLAEKKPYLRRASTGAGAAPAAKTKGTRGFDASKATPAQLIAEGLKQRGITR